MTFEFKVTDAEGLWGSLRSEGSGPDEAADKCLQWCEEEAEREGSTLMLPVTLELIE